MRNQDKPAFPVSKEMCEQKNEIEEYPYGLTKREYFAAMAMRGFLLSEGSIRTPGALAELSLDYADALLKELEE